MKKVLEDFPCYEDRQIDVIEGGRRKQMEGPRIPVFGKLKVSNLHYPNTTVEVRALLDTGNDITIIRRKKVLELEEALDQDIYELRQISYYGKNDVIVNHPAFPLSLIFSEEDRYSSKYGFIAPSEYSWNFEDFDMWIGRDIFNQLIVTFDGANGTVTLADRNRNSEPGGAPERS